MINRRQYTDTLHKLVSHNTVSAVDLPNDMPNQSCLEILAEQLENLGFMCSIEPVPLSNNKYNLIAHRAGTKSQTGGLLFSGHIDTVAAAAEQWNEDPWKLQIDEYKLSGLGATDMKGFFALLVHTLRDLSVEHPLPISIIATADEETSMAGARALKSEVLGAPKLAIIGEPTQLNPVLSHKGYLAYRLTLTGSGGHSSSDDRHLNTLDALLSIMRQLDQLRKSWDRVHQSQFSVPVTSLNFGSVKAGDSVNRLCETTQFEFDIRPLPGVTVAEIEQQLHNAILEGIKIYRVDHNLAALFDPFPSFNSSLTPADKAVLSHCCGNHFDNVNYVTEASFFEQQGIPTIVMGPGSIEQAHTANEYIEWQQIEIGQRRYRSLIDHYVYGD